MILIMLLKKYTELLNSEDSLSKIQLFHLEYLLNKNNFKELNNILIKILILLLLLIKCKIHIELKKYYKAKVDWV